MDHAFVVLFLVLHSLPLIIQDLLPILFKCRIQMIRYDGLVSGLYGAQIRRIPQESFREIVTRKHAEATVVRIVQRVRPNDVVGIVSEED